MPNYTVSANIDTMLRAADNAAIRSAIGVGQTDAPTFLAQTLTNNASIASGKIIIGLDGTNDYTIQAFQGATRVGRIGLNEISNNIVIAPFANTFTLFTGGISIGATPPNNDCFIQRDAAGILAQRNGTNTQSLRIYNTYTDASNYERVSIGHSAGAFQILSDALGTGAAKQLQIGTNTAASLVLTTANTLRWQVTSAGHFLAATDNTYDIGASGANRPKDIYASGMISSFGYIRSTAGFRFLAGGSYFVESGNGVLNLTDSSLAGFGRLQLGGTTDSFPAIARDGAGTKFTGGAAGSTSWIKVPAVAVSALPSFATAGVGARAFVNDALTPVFGSAVTGGGAVTVPVYSTGSAWNVG